MPYVSLRVRCIRDPKKHAKVLRLRETPLDLAERIADILTGQSREYSKPVGDKSPIGRCAICGGKLEYQLLEIDENAEPENKSSAAGRQLCANNPDPAAARGSSAAAPNGYPK